MRIGQEVDLTRPPLLLAGICLYFTFVLQNRMIWIIGSFVISRSGWSLILCTNHRTNVHVEMPVSISGKQWIYCDARQWLLGLKTKQFFVFSGFMSRPYKNFGCYHMIYAYNIFNWISKFYCSYHQNFWYMRLYWGWLYPFDHPLRKSHCKAALCWAEWWM